MGYESDGMVAVILVVYIVIIAIAIIANWKIWSKAGFAGAWSLLMIIPLVGLGAYLYLAFAEWPVQRRVRELEGPETFS